MQPSTLTPNAANIEFFRDKATILKEAGTVPHYVFYFGSREDEVELPCVREKNYPYQLREGDIVIVEEKMARQVLQEAYVINEMVVDSLVYFLRDPESDSENVCMVFLLPNNI